MARRFAQAFDQPLVKWPLHLLHDIEEGVREQLLAEEPNMFGYFVAGAPVTLSQTLRSVRGLVNGSPGLLHSLSFAGDTVPDELAEAAPGFCEVELKEAPLAVNVRVGSTRSAPYTWHGTRLRDLTGLIASVASGEDQVVPIFRSKNAEYAELRGVAAACNGIAEKLKVIVHQYIFSFALTDCTPAPPPRLAPTYACHLQPCVCAFNPRSAERLTCSICALTCLSVLSPADKLQGLTLNKLVLNLRGSARPPFMTLAAFYVFISRVRSWGSLRVLRRDAGAMEQLTKLRSDEHLGAWEGGYDAAGVWQDALAKAQLQRLRARWIQERNQATKEARARKRKEQMDAAAKKRQKPTAGGKKRKTPHAQPGGACSPHAPTGDGAAGLNKGTWPDDDGTEAAFEMMQGPDAWRERMCLAELNRSE